MCNGLACSRERREEEEKREREKSEMLEREKAEKERQERHKKEEQERVQREAVQQHFEESLRLASQKVSAGRARTLSLVHVLSSRPNPECSS